MIGPMRSAGWLSGRMRHSQHSSTAQMPRTVRPVRRHSIAPDGLVEPAGKGMLDAEALALALDLASNAQLTAAWSALPSRLLGQRTGQLTYEVGVRLYLSQGAAMQHAAANRRQAQGTRGKHRLRVVIADVGGAGGGGAAAHKLPAEAGSLPAAARGQRSSGSLVEAVEAVEAVLQHLPDVESHLEPGALALALYNSPTSTAAVHVAALADAAWRRVPSTVLGPRPTWTDAYPEEYVWQWSYGRLLLLSAAVGFRRVLRALAQPCLELACLELQPFSDEARLKLNTAIGNVERIAGVSLAQLLHRRSAPEAAAPTQMGSGDALDSGLQAGAARGTAPQASQGGILLSTRWSHTQATKEGELLQLSIADCSGERAVEFSPPWLLPPPATISDYDLPATVYTLQTWAKLQRGRDLFVQGWGSFPVSLQPYQQGSLLPTPTQVRAHGYTAALFPLADEYAASRIHRILTDPSSQLARYIVKWSSRVNGPLAARIGELEAVELSQLDFDLPPETLLRRLERAGVLSAAPLERFHWLTEQPAGDEPRILASKTGSGGRPLHVLLLTTSHQIALAGRALHNCIGRDSDMLGSHVSRVRDQEEMLLVLSPSTDIKEATAMATWVGGPPRWSEIYESCNQPIRPEWKAMLVDAQEEVRRIWDSGQRPLISSDLFYAQLMRWEHPRIDAVITCSGIGKHTFAARLSTVLADLRESFGGQIQGGQLAALLIREMGCSELFSPGHYCSYTSLKRFTQQLPFPAVWEVDGCVEFRLEGCTGW